ncbi:hypothetical protein SPRG_07834 [Saprolegnia parasitica CBS 223.65]|uniref:Uncharacterized protein n=1 Tax=Saprolegnia parasitica (strain CBS 223.65) TaxID=695850 RepID=A0A067C9E9_SAPPC|nr:hypothetical protein SPRG_07834 [Saprolegnia parasitica CBS 223.65]KDO27123.1 hypothetical protein SPRG_07834 [Saprolegnia parasitica CBS 223.65]|eukprot:XP_012202216.1 hypothetical protein SPRG_07834 [Saprolegnia parasitica CBS 223.65]
MDEAWTDTAFDGLDFSVDDAQLLATMLAQTPAPAPPSLRERQRLSLQAHRKRQADELAFLQRTVDDLQSQLSQLNQVQVLQEIMAPPTRWERLAKDERRRQVEASQENRRLKAALEEQVQFAESLAKLVHKKPRLQLYADSPSDAWKQFKLVADPSVRHAAFHAIVDRDYTRTDSAFVEARLHDATEPRREHVPTIEGGIVLLQTTVLVRWQVDFDITAAAIWDVLRGVVPMSHVPGSYTQLTNVDAHTSYVSSLRHLKLGRMQRRIITKRYIESPTRWIIVCRNVHEDEVLPLDPNAGISDEVMWVLIERERHETVIKYFRKAKPPLVMQPSASLDATSICEYLIELSQKHT